MSNTIKYRPDIDGLRAIAVISVIIYHAKISFADTYVLNGGFLGVDIFFVISGYLITSIILREIKIKKNFSFQDFYLRRSRRILPVLLIVFLFTFLLGYLFLEPIFFSELSKSIISSIFFFSNLFFYYSGIQYDAQSSLVIPLLHTWSLSVEEQFYLIYPLILLTIIKLLKFSYHFFLSIIILSLLSSEFLSHYNQELNFYLLTSRIWELMLGSLCAFIKIKYYKCLLKNNEIQIIHILGTLLIFLSFVFFSDNDRNPSLITLLPVIGTVLIIFFESKDSIIFKILSSKLFVFIGLISYSLYLWHYPVFAFSRIIFEGSDKNILLVKIIIPLIILILSLFTFYCIEKPFRNKSFISKKSFIITLLSFLLINIIINILVIKNEGFTNRVPKILTKENINDRGRLEDENGICDERLNKFCELGSKDDPRIILLGDSQMAAIEYQLAHKALNNNYSFSSITKMSCIYLPEFLRVNIKKNLNDKNCNPFTQDIKKKFLNKNKNSIIVLGGRYTMYLSGTKFNNMEGGIESVSPWDWRFIHRDKKFSPEEGVKKSILELTKNNKVVLIYPIPEVGWHVPQKIFLNHRIESLKFWQSKDDIMKKKQNITTSYKVYLNRNKKIIELFDSISSKNIYRVYPHKIFCNLDTKRCNAHDEDNIYYYDHHHLSTYGANLLSDEIIKKIKINR